MAGPQTETIDLATARALVARAFTANGVPQATAGSVADALVAAEAEGQRGHGFTRVEDYVAQVRSGKIVADARPVATRPAPASLAIDAGHGFAFPALDLARGRAGEIAAAQGCVTVAITRSHHCGALSVQVDRLARQGLVALMVANAPAAMAPWGAATPFFGTNPIAFAAPRGNLPPLVIDLSLSVVARGKVMAARKAGERLPEGWALDPDGRPTTDPEAALAGTMRPIGGAKGTALALMVEILASVVTAATPSADASSFFDADGPPPGVGQWLLAFAPPEGAAAFGDRLDALLARIEAMEGTRLPGARRLDALDAAEAAGLTVRADMLAGLRALADGG